MEKTTCLSKIPCLNICATRVHDSRPQQGAFPAGWVGMSLIVAVGLLLLALVSPSLGEAQMLDPHVGMTLKAGSTGAGIELTKSIFEDVNIRIGYNRFQLSNSITEDGIKYDGDLRLETIPIFLDWHVLSGGFRLSTGVLYNNNKLDLESRATGTVVVGNTAIDAGTLGTLNGKVEMGNSIAPYLGIGWGMPSIKTTGGEWLWT